MNENVKLIRRLSALLAVAAILIVSGICALANKPYDGMSIVFIDVGQGDSALITTPKTAVLIDAGPDRSADRVSAELDRCGVRELDAVICSHSDSDHISGMPEILENYEVKRLCVPEFGFRENEDTSDLLAGLNEQGKGAEYVGAGYRLGLGDIDLEFISPSRDYGDSNENSVVVKVTYGKTSALFTGDISSEVEKTLDNVRADVLKVAHHGSRFSSSEEFLKRVKPKIAVASLSKYNEYNHPSIEVMDRLAKLNCDAYLTSESGNVTVRSNGSEISVSVEK